MTSILLEPVARRNTFDIMSTLIDEPAIFHIAIWIIHSPAKLPFLKAHSINHVVWFYKTRPYFIPLHEHIFDLYVHK